MAGQWQWMPLLVRMCGRYVYKHGFALLSLYFAIDFSCLIANFNTFLQLSLFTILVYDEHQNGVPVAWALLEKSNSGHLKQFLSALKIRVEKFRAENLQDPEWRPNNFIIDVASEEILSIRYYIILICRGVYELGIRIGESFDLNFTWHV